MLAAALVQPPHRFRVNPHKAGRAFDTGAFTQMLTHRNRLSLRDLAVPQGRVLTFAEFFPTAPAAQEPDPVMAAVFFPDDEIGGASLTVQLAFRVDTC